MARFLQRLAASDVGFTRSRLQAAVRLNYDLFRGYLALLEEKGLAEVVEDASGRDVIRATEAGRTAHAALEEWMRGVLGDVFR